MLSPFPFLGLTQSGLEPRQSYEITHRRDQQGLPVLVCGYNERNSLFVNRASRGVIWSSLRLLKAGRLMGKSTATKPSTVRSVQMEYTFHFITKPIDEDVIHHGARQGERHIGSLPV